MKTQEQLAFHLFQVIHTHVSLYHQKEPVIEYYDDTMPYDLKNILNTYINQMIESKQNDRSKITIQQIQNLDFSFLSILNQEDLWVIGPFLEKTHTTKAVNALVVMLKGNAQMADYISRFYEHIPILEPHIIRFIHRMIETYQSYVDDEPIKYFKQIKTKKTTSPESIDQRDEYRLYVKRNYEIEDHLMHAITLGDREALKNVFKEMRQFYLPERVPHDTLRNRKNNLVILNSLSTRKAIEGGLDIYHAHQISTLNAIKIEQLTSPLEIDDFMRDMLFVFTDAVHLYQTKGYPHLIKEAILYIYRNITQPLTLERIAEHLFITPEHLSRMMKKYTQKTVHDVIIETKIDEAKKMISQQELTMIDIAHILGFSSSSHFSTVFSRYCGMSPSTYQKSLLTHI
jgi:AraC-like DNA-binding protein